MDRRRSSAVAHVRSLIPLFVQSALRRTIAPTARRRRCGAPNSWVRYGAAVVRGVQRRAKGNGHPPVTDELREKTRALTEALIAKRRDGGLNFFDVADQLPKGGKGMKVSRKMWKRYEEPCFYTVTRVKFAKVRIIIGFVCGADLDCV
jgi:hypothetical protein